MFDKSIYGLSIIYGQVLSQTFFCFHQLSKDILKEMTHHLKALFLELEPRWY